VTSSSSPSTPGEPRVCAQCGKVESERLWLYPGRMFKIWKGASSPVDLCSFECSAKWHAPKGPSRCDQYRDLLEAWAHWWDGPGRDRFNGHVLPPLSDTSSATPQAAAITAEMLRAAETHHGDSCSYCNSAGDIDCPTAAVLDALAAATSPAPGDNP